MKLPILLHELGHVKDHENQINFDGSRKTADVVEAEVYANLFALDECFRRGYFESGEMWFASLMRYKDDTDYRGECVRRLLTRFHKPAYRSWQSYDI
jgi:hypothetical protein